MDEQQKNEHSKFARMFVDYDELEKPKHESHERVSVSERIEYAAKVFFYILFALFLIPIIMLIVGIGGPGFEQVGWIMPMAVFPLMVFLGAAISFGKTFKKTNSGIQSNVGNRNEVDV